MREREGEKERQEKRANLCYELLCVHELTGAIRDPPGVLEPPAVIL